jgi:hypothetical protein
VLRLGCELAIQNPPLAVAGMADFAALILMLAVAPGFESPSKSDGMELNSGSAPQDGFALTCQPACFQSEADRRYYTENG